jgi:hypothetical protein
LIPTGNSEILAERIHGAELLVIPGGAHPFTSAPLFKPLDSFSQFYALFLTPNFP